MISTDEALTRILALLSPVDTEVVPLAEATGRVLAADVQALRDQPPFPSSAMDGYAVRGDDLNTGAKLKVTGEAAAGHRFDGPVGPGEAVRIFTGAPVPDGTDTILIQEDATRCGDTISVHENRDTGTYIRPAGSDFAARTALPAPHRLGPHDIALLAAMNIDQVPVRQKPVIALIPTGDELVMPGDTPGPDQIVTSNNFGLKALLEAHGAEARLIPIARDSRDSLEQAFSHARGADLMVTLGGASVGDHDLVQDVATGQGLSLDFYKIAMRPGKPLMAGCLNETPLVGLPGNPVSAMVCGHIFLRPALDLMLGLPAGPLPRIRARLSNDLPANGGREHFMRARLEGGAPPDCMVFRRQDSSLLSVLAVSNALAVRAPHAPALEAGAEIDVIRL